MIVLELRAIEEEALLFGRVALLLVDLNLEVVDGLAGLHFKYYRLADQSPNVDLDAS